MPLPAGRVLEAVATPGHTAGHLVFHDLAGGLLFAGDHVLPTITPSIGFEPVLSREPARGVPALAWRWCARGRTPCCCRRTGAVTDSVHARVDELVAHHGAAAGPDRGGLRAGRLDAREVAGLLRWTRREHRLTDLDPFNAMLAVFETGAHLELLVAQRPAGAAGSRTASSGTRRGV